MQIEHCHGLTVTYGRIPVVLKAFCARDYMITAGDTYKALLLAWPVLAACTS